MRLNKLRNRVGGALKLRLDFENDLLACAFHRLNNFLTRGAVRKNTARGLANVQARSEHLTGFQRAIDARNIGQLPCLLKPADLRAKGSARMQNINAVNR